MKKADRQNVFEKYGGRCAYCGCELTKGWHVDHLEPIRRNKKYRSGYWKEIATGRKVSVAEINKIPEMENLKDRFKWVSEGWVADGCLHPEKDCIENYMPSCASCNINKHGDTIEGFRNSIQAYMKHLNEISTQYKIAKRYGLVIETNQPVKFYFETLSDKQNLSNPPIKD